MIMKRMSTQSGITLSGLIMASVVFGTLAVTGMKLWPIYNEKFKVDLAMDKLATLPEGSRMTKVSAARAIERQFDVQDVDTIDFPRLMKILEVTQIKGSPNKLATLRYEIRAPFFSNLDIVMNYAKTVELGTATTD